MGPARPGRQAPPGLAPEIVVRRRLFERLDRRPTTVITGTAGYGKSSLLSSWLSQGAVDRAAGWLTVDGSDRDPGRFAADLLAALSGSAAESLAVAVRDLRPPPLFASPVAFVDSVLEALYDLDVPTTVILDDVQHLSGSDQSLELVDHVLRWAPATTRLILSGRTIPRLRLQRLRLEDRVELIGPRDLAFTLEETRDVVAASGVDLSSAAATSLHEVTQGWPAAVRMALLAVRAGGVEDLSLELRRDDALADYLTTEVLATLDDELRAFLQAATVDDVVCPSLVDAVSDSHDAAALLERCATEGLFLTRENRTGTEPWYRWHALFAAQVRRRRAVEDPLRSRGLELRAARWWDGTDTATAVEHALHAGATEVAAELTASHWLRLALEGRTDTVLSLLAAVPTGAGPTAELHLARAFVDAQAGRIENARLSLRTARREAAHLDPLALARFDTRATVIEVFLVDDRAALADAVTSGGRLLRHAADGPWVPDGPTIALVQLYVGMGEARLQANLALALRLLRDAARSAADAGLDALELAALAETCVPSIAEGRLQETRRVAEQVISSAEAKGWSDLRSTGPAHGYLGWLALWQGDGIRSREQLERCLSLLLPNDWGMQGLTLTTLAQACLLTGDLAAARLAAEQAHELASSDRMPPWWPSLLQALDATITWAGGDEAGALAQARAPEAGAGYNLADCLRARIMLAAGDARGCLQRLDGIPHDRRYAHIPPVIHALSAQAHWQLGRLADAHAELEAALAAAAESSLITPFLLLGAAGVPLLRAQIDRGTAHPELVAVLIDRLTPTSRAAVNEWGDTLTERERTILGYLATTLSNNEIADAEFISVNTAKTHIAHIYRKLGVTNRRAAVRRGAELGLI